MSVRKKFFWISAFIIITAVVVVLCVGYFTGNQATEFEGTLVQRGIEFIC